MQRETDHDSLGVLRCKAPVSRVHLHRLSHLFIWHFILALSLALRAFSVEDPQKTTPFEAFRSFLVSPPPIEQLTYRVRLLADPSNPDLGVHNSKYFQTYTAVWQANAWIVRALWPQDNAEVTKVIRGRSMFVYDKHYWHLEPGKLVQWIDDDPVVDGVRIEIGAKSVNRTKAVAQFLWHGMVETLNMGVFNLEPGTLKWDGNRFSGVFAQQKQHIEGELFASNGWPSQIVVSYSVRTNKETFIVRYDYEQKTGLDFIPSHIRTTQLLPNKQREQSDILVLQIKPGDLTQPKSFFDPAPFLQTNQASQFYTNGALYELDREGKLVLAKMETEVRGRRSTNPYSFYAAGSTAFVAFVRPKNNSMLLIACKKTFTR